MNRQEYKEEAERLLKRAEESSTPNYTEKLVSIARVYAMLAAIPDEQDMRGEIHDRRPDVSGGTPGFFGH